MSNQFIAILDGEDSYVEEREGDQLPCEICGKRHRTESGAWSCLARHAEGIARDWRTIAKERRAEARRTML